MTSKQVVPVLVLRDIVLFPPIIYPLEVTREKSKAAALAAGEGGVLVCVAQHTDGGDDSSPDDLYSMGTLVRVNRLRATRATVAITVEALERRQVHKFTRIDPFLEARVMPVEMPLDDDNDSDLEFLAGRVLGRVEASSGLTTEQRFLLGSVDERSTLADMMASILPLDVEVKQGLLETLSAQKRHQQLLELV